MLPMLPMLRHLACVFVARTSRTIVKAVGLAITVLGKRTSSEIKELVLTRDNGIRSAERPFVTRTGDLLLL